MQRLYSTFPTGAPGMGLLLLRGVTGGFLIADSVARILQFPASPWPEVFAALALAGACVCMGLWTPLTAGTETCGELFLALQDTSAGQLHGLLAVAALSLSLLGPGAWSLDSRIFGRKRIRL